MNDINNLIFSSFLSLLISLATALATAFIAYFFYWRQIKADLQKEYESRFNTKKWETYLGMNDIIQGIYYREQTDEAVSVTLEDKIRLLRTQILLIGSKHVIDAYGSWQAQRARYEDYHENTFEKLHALIMEMRKDLGLHDSQFELEVMRGLFPRKR